MVLLDPLTLFILKKLILSVFLGALIGIEREIANKSAGMRTHALVALGSTLFTVAPALLSGPLVDPTRIAAQVVTGIGFLGAGIIFFDQSHSRVQGLTTAAGVWVAAAIGVAVGFGLMEVAVWATLLTILVFLVLWPVERKFVKRFSRDDLANGD